MLLLRPRVCGRLCKATGPVYVKGLRLREASHTGRCATLRNKATGTNIDVAIIRLHNLRNIISNSWKVDVNL